MEKNQFNGNTLEDIVSAVLKELRMIPIRNKQNDVELVAYVCNTCKKHFKNSGECLKNLVCKDWLYLYEVERGINNNVGHQ